MHSSTEAFAVACIDNNYEKWPKMYKTGEKFEEDAEDKWAFLGKKAP